MRNLIRVELNAGVWHARFMGPQADAIVSLFGTDTIPTPFTSETCKGVVVTELTKRNPTSEVM